MVLRRSASMRSSPGFAYLAVFPGGDLPLSPHVLELDEAPPLRSDKDGQSLGNVPQVGSPWPAAVQDGADAAELAARGR